MSQFHFQPVIIIGAARSGTNMIRDVLTQLPSVGTWPCDEINYIWRYGNARFETDELMPSQATSRTIHYIRHQFARQAARTKAHWLIEKTCANSLRVDFVKKVIPEAKFIFLVRDGWDASHSAEKRWQASLDLGYLARKAAFVPISDVPYYAFRYARHRVQKIVSGTSRLPTWGPRCQGLDEWVQHLTPQEVCIRQWQACVEKASEALSHYAANDVHYIRYEDFVWEPSKHLCDLCQFLGIPYESPRLDELSRQVFIDSLGNGLTGQNKNLEPLVQEALARVEKTWRPARSNFKRLAA